MLMSRQGVVVDQMAFDESMHDPLLKVTKGVSLERVSWEVPSSQSDNWHSAAASVGYGTPGCANSMAMDVVEDLGGGFVKVEPEVFSPDGDGYDDHCVVSYDFGAAGCRVNTYIFTADGRLVRHLVKGELAGREGRFVWNGLDHRGSPVPLGIYVMVTEVFDEEGEVRRYRNVVAVASR